MAVLFSLFTLIVVVSTRYFLIPSLLGLDSNANLLQYLDVLFNTPYTSYKTLKECIIMLNYNGNSNLGSNLNQAPLYVSFFNVIPERLHFYIFCLFDIGSFYYIIQITNNRNEKELGPNSSIKLILYLLNPLIYINLLMKTTFVIIQFCIIMAIYHIQQSKSTKSINIAALMFAVVTYLDIYNLGLVLVLFNFIKDNKSLFLASYGSVFTIFMAVSFKLQPTFIMNNIVSKILFKEQYPNIGLWWYFFIEMFQEYRDFFKFVFNCYCYIFVLPIFIRFKNYSLQAFVILFTWITAFKPYPTIGELGFILLVFVYWFDLRIIEHKLIMCLLIIHSIILLPVFYHLWITIGSGNSNFFYALTLVYVVSVVLILLGMIKSVLYWEYEDDHQIVSTENKSETEINKQEKLNLVSVQ
ncbi:hypothetical protein QEN19_000834 [Hanseniaspora menglaensis]